MNIATFLTRDLREQDHKSYVASYCAKEELVILWIFSHKLCQWKWFSKVFFCRQFPIYGISKIWIKSTLKLVVPNIAEAQQGNHIILISSVKWSFTSTVKFHKVCYSLASNLCRPSHIADIPQSNYQLNIIQAQVSTVDNMNSEMN